MIALLTLCVLWYSGLHNVAGDANSDLNSLFDEFFQWRLQDSPELASFLNVHDYDDKLDDYSLNHFNKIEAKVGQFQSSLKRIDYNSLSRQQQYNYKVFNNSLVTAYNGYQWRMYLALTPMTFMSGPQTVSRYIVTITPFKTKRDFEYFLSRLHLMPHQVQQEIALMKIAIVLSRTMNAVSMTRIPAQIDALLTSNMTDFVFYKPFLAPLDKLNMTLMEKEELRTRARLEMPHIIQAFNALKQFIKTEYIPHARGSYGVGGLFEGTNFYNQVLKWHTTVDLTPIQVHQIGLNEMKRIRNEMIKIMRRQNFNGTIAQYFDMLQRNPKFHFKTKEEILAKYRDILYNRIYPTLPRLFKNLPTLKVRVTELKTDGPPALYTPGFSDGSVPGQIQINVFRPQEVLSYFIPSIALHEGVPGHHFQISKQQQSNLPKFRKEDTGGPGYSVPFAFPGFTAFVEGWALYTESLGEELGVYKDDYELMGRYNGEMFRALRLVVDTGIHYLGWTRTRSLNLFKQYTSMTGGALDNEVDRYISIPGQACAYKIGELKIRELRKKAETALGSKFDIRDFHDVILSSGSMSLDLLATVVNDWISDVRNPQRSTSSVPTSSVSTSAYSTIPSTHAPVTHTTSNNQLYTGQIPLIPNIG